MNHQVTYIYLVEYGEGDRHNYVCGAFANEQTAERYAQAELAQLEANGDQSGLSVYPLDTKVLPQDQWGYRVTKLHLSRA
jgi:hypothetical protein